LGQIVVSSGRKQAPYETILVSRNALLREGLARILGSADFRIVASVPDFADLNQLPLMHEPQFLLIVEMSDDNLDRVAARVDAFKRTYPTARLAILAPRLEVNDIASAFRAGADAVFVEIATSDAFIKSLELVMLGETMLPSGLLTLILEQNTGPPPRDLSLTHHNTVLQVEEAEDDSTGDDDEPPAMTGGEGVADVPAPEIQLSPRQKFILRYLISGDSNKAIARQTQLAEATVKVHVKAILRKIRVHNRTQAAIWAVNNGQTLPTQCPDSLAPPILPDESAFDSEPQADQIRTIPYRANRQ
jgi:two-component system nitrate/nitrite response regulator NarL